ncbi:tetratricopeptide repeat protein 17 [Galendromus occidentalis]|uniref:Tetratricopeptide repeat protein 17 n=1 Tax=Galendromus occidentalis TaxID=34638 RepID=A0AAJ6QRG5_9ACAR|nr:tetratricopeptide repeat protein 17 [Galendromus occidentalis]
MNSRVRGNSISFSFAATIVFALCGVDGFSHWIASDDGEIRPQSPSIFALRSPGDLPLIHKQEERLETVRALRKELLQRKEEIDRSEEEAENIEERLYAEDTDCQIAGTPLTEMDLYVSTVVPFETKLRPRKLTSPREVQEPDCTRYLKLDFSMHAFEHLMGVRERRNLSMVSETGLHKALSEADVEDVEHFGEVITELLETDSNWTAFNLAALYWRERGSAAAAVECLRRALHVSPHEVKDVALISLANVLHRGHRSDEAAVVVHAAIDIAPDNPICHFTLGNIYAVLGEYNKSVICYDNMLKLQPEFRSARQRLHAVRCHAKVENALERQHQQLQNVLDKLKEYQHRKEIYVQLMGQLIEEAVPPQIWQKDCESSRKDWHTGDEPPGFPFFDNMLDLQFNVRPGDKITPACDEDSPKANFNKIEAGEKKILKKLYNW